MSDRPCQPASLRHILERQMTQTVKPPEAVINLNNPTRISSARPVRMYGIELVEHQWPLVELGDELGGGPYIVEMVRELRRSLRCGGYLTDLNRTLLGP